jgi:Zn-dependent M28 family amino/carboxypeptidase
MVAFQPTRPQDLKTKLENIVGERNPFTSPRHLDRVERYIEDELKSYGLVVESDFFSYRGRRYRNVIGRLGNRLGEAVIIVGAHFDTVSSTAGADDNASGVAVLLEAAKILSGHSLRTPVLFCAFNLEELNMIGSTHFAQKLRAERVKVKAMMSLEMVGFVDARPGRQKYPPGLGWFYPERGDFIGVIGNFSSYGLLRNVSRRMRQVSQLKVEGLVVLGNGFLVPQVRLSDHAPFWDVGYPALMVTDTAFFRNPHYHGPTDTLETLDLGFMSRVCQGVVNAVRGL